ncbi:MAG TPA: mycofactocin biosynthesis chaperone MftB [Bacillota bacterium]|nr:mycofactocin biosynthesis chaperone MftB [Peptococcaceae bacterium MAG4]NLW37876.1 mycofactocin biosynthesis chaperone MftB [Peptococcaceae bacterium]HPU35340.1 mycofactocin biosynthesis chaperone MftB [Bacillota bacterium]HPZ43289.1 mycofactocin biosynthesis chaperone MftB [Bacillota bacterium]HQD75160.1 mycofactocin biosynthesis chaperone MftB [Bacillota bacterium]
MDNTIYKLPSGLRVRKEAFGLLFYNVKDTNLTFVRVDGDLIPDSLWEKGLIAPEGRGGKEDPKYLKILKELVKRGLLVETRISEH